MPKPRAYQCRSDHWIESGLSLDHFTDNETSPGGGAPSSSGEGEEEDDRSEDPMERVGQNGPMEESEGPDLPAEMRYFRMDAESENEENEDEQDGGDANDQNGRIRKFDEENGFQD
ncbi:unnamed protein product [Durusdinium trenchii]|uniref:Uncharacterized protein n=1 Tax=Durusdinium trenchii TaxID=1381693 RepID=A0ABP0JVW7_9DINO